MLKKMKKKVPKRNKNLSASVQNKEKNDIQECPICLDGITNDDTCTLPCKHVLHKTCCKKWFRQKMNCPICRYEMRNLPRQWLGQLQIFRRNHMQWQVRPEFENNIVSNSYFFRKFPKNT